MVLQRSWWSLILQCTLRDHIIGMSSLRCMCRKVLNKSQSSPLTLKKHVGYSRRTSPLFVLIWRTPPVLGTALLPSEAAAPAAAPQLEAGRTGADDGRAGNSAEPKKSQLTCHQLKTTWHAPESCCGGRGAREACAAALLLNVPLKN